MQTQHVNFKVEGDTLVGKLFLPEGFSDSNQYTGVVVSGSWTTVKEQMTSLYAELLARHGLVALAFDFRNYARVAASRAALKTRKQKPRTSLPQRVI